MSNHEETFGIPPTTNRNEDSRNEENYFQHMAHKITLFGAEHRFNIDDSSILEKCLVSQCNLEVY